MNPTQRFDAIVLGGDANALAAALVLQRAGRRTVVLVEQETAGGEARSVEFAPGYRVAPLALEAGWLPPRAARGLGITPPPVVYAEPQLTVAVEPGRFLSLSRDVRSAQEAIRAHSAEDAARWPGFVALAGRLAQFLEKVYQHPVPEIDATAPHDLVTALRLGWALRKLGREAIPELLRVIPMSVAEFARDWFTSDVVRAAVVACGVRDIRQGPRSGGTGFVLLHHLVGAPQGSVRRAAYWEAGPDQLLRVLQAAARQAGVTIRTGARVARVHVDDYRVRGVVLSDGEEVAARVVLSAHDPARTLGGFVDSVWLDPEFLHAVAHIKFRGATAFVLYALDGLPEVPGLADAPPALAGAVSLTCTPDALERAYDATKYGEVSAEPHVELTLPSLRWSALAPAGRHVAVARVAFAPYRLRDGAGWDARRRDALGDAVTRAIACVAPAFGDRVVHRAVLAPPDIEREYGFTEGAAAGGELTLDQILFMRPVAGWARYAMPIAGLYLCGAGAHPGPGVAGGPGWLAARQVLRGGRT